MSPARPLALLIVSSADTHAISFTLAPGNADAKSAYVVGPAQSVKLRKLSVPVTLPAAVVLPAAAVVAGAAVVAAGAAVVTAAALVAVVGAAVPAPVVVAPPAPAALLVVALLPQAARKAAGPAVAAKANNVRREIGCISWLLGWGWKRLGANRRKREVTVSLPTLRTF